MARLDVAPTTATGAGWVSQVYQTSFTASRGSEGRGQQRWGLATASRPMAGWAAIL